MFERPWLEKRGQRSDRHGVIERDPTVGIAGSAFHPGDCTADGAVAEYDPQVPAVGNGSTGLQGSGTAEQARSLRRQAVGLAEDGGGQVPQEAANSEAAPCRPGRPGLRRFLRQGCGLRTEVEGRPPAGGAERRARHLRTAGLSARGGIPVRLERGLGDDCRGEHEAPGRPHQALASRAFLLRAYFLQTHEMLFDAHWHAFRVFGGVPGRGIYDSVH